MANGKLRVTFVLHFVQFVLPETITNINTGFKQEGGDQIQSCMCSKKEINGF
jgi:hypothetical protein